MDNNKKSNIDKNLADNSDLLKKIKALRDINLKPDFKIDITNFPTPDGDGRGGNSGAAGACTRVQEEEKEVQKKRKIKM